VLAETADAATTLGLLVQLVEVRKPDDLNYAFSKLARDRAETVFQLPSTMLFNERKRIVDLASGLYFGSTKMNNFFDVVDDVVKEAGGTATLFVKAGDEYVRVATNVKKDDGSRAIGTILDPKGKAIESIKKNEAYYGDADILGKAYATGYEPIRDAGKNVIGIYYVGYLK
jgi:hypothetical protein